jgi:signal transduction histidine kinase
MAALTDTPPITKSRRRRDLLPKPRPSVRLRLTALYGTLFVLAGAGLVAVTNVLVRAFAPSQAQVNVPSITALLNGARPPRNARFTQTVSPPTQRQAVAKVPASLAYLKAHPPINPKVFRGDAVHIVVSGALVQHSSDQNALLWWSIVAFALMAIVSVALAWWLAGRALRPLRLMTATANTISATNLHERLDLAGPDDELKRLAETFNGLLGRLEVAFDAQRRFVANASHELRTPLARQRAVAEVALSDPDATVDSLRASYERVIAAGEEEERLIAALLLLARSDRGIEHKSPVDLDEIVRRTVASMNGELRAKQLGVETSLDASLVMGDPELVERLVVNLIDNAIVHNTEQGFVKISTATDSHGTSLTIENSGEAIEPDDVERLMRPFERADGARTNHNGRLGLGLSIVDAIARAHDASVRVVAREQGGLEVRIEFPRGTSASDTTADGRRLGD